MQQNGPKPIQIGTALFRESARLLN